MGIARGEKLRPRDRDLLDGVSRVQVEVENLDEKRGGEAAVLGDARVGNVEPRRALAVHREVGVNLARVCRGLRLRGALVVGHVANVLIG